MIGKDQVLAYVLGENRFAEGYPPDGAYGVVGLLGDLDDSVTDESDLPSDEEEDAHPPE